MKKFHFLIFIYVIMAFFPNAFAQVEACFSLDYERGCIPFKVKALDCSGADPNLIMYQFESSQAASTSNEYTFTKAGTYTIKQIINSGNGGKITEKTIEIFEPKEVDFVLIACPDLGVSVRIMDTNYEQYEVDFGDGNTETITNGQMAMHNYSNATARKIKVTGQYKNGSNNCSSKTLSYTPKLEFPFPILNRITNNKNETIDISYTVDKGYGYTLEAGKDGSFQTVDAVSDVANKVTITPSDFSNLYRLRTDNNCSADVFISKEVNIQKLSALSEDNKITLTWNESVLRIFGHYKLYRNNQLITTIQDRAKLFYQDTDVSCNVEYCYRIEAYADAAQSNGIIPSSVSNTVCVRATSQQTPQALKNVFTTVNNDGGITLSWEFAPLSEVKTIFIERKSEVSGDKTFTIHQKQTSFVDNEVNAEQGQAHYVLYFKDPCEKESPRTESYSPVFLTAEEHSDNILLTRTNYLPFDSTASYTLERLDEKFELIAKTSMDTTVFEDSKEDLSSQVIYYRIKAKSPSNAKEASYSNVISFKFPAVAVFPTAFTPNDDNLNDTFGLAKSKFITEYRLTIYNQWGSPVFDTTDMEQKWDGKQDGKPCPADAYIYQVELKDSTGFQFRKKGTILLMR